MFKEAGMGNHAGGDVESRVGSLLPWASCVIVGAAKLGTVPRCAVGGPSVFAPGVYIVRDFSWFPPQLAW